MRCIARQPVKVGNRDRPCSGGTADLYRRVHRRQCYGPVTGRNGVTSVAGAENGLPAINATDTGASGAGLPLVARVSTDRTVSEIGTAGSLQQVAATVASCGVAGTQLLKGSRREPDSHGVWTHLASSTSSGHQAGICRRRCASSSTFWQNTSSSPSRASPPASVTRRPVRMHERL